MWQLINSDKDNTCSIFDSKAKKVILKYNDDIDKDELACIVNSYNKLIN